jgi:hypothetical protein
MQLQVCRVACQIGSITTPSLNRVLSGGLSAELSLVGRIATDRGLVIPGQTFVRCSQKVNSHASSSDEQAIAA